MPEPTGLSEGEKARALAELYRRLGGTRLPEDFSNGAPDTVLLRFLAARGFDVDKAFQARPSTAERPREPPKQAASARRSASRRRRGRGRSLAPVALRRARRACGGSTAAPAPVAAHSCCCSGLAARCGRSAARQGVSKRSRAGDERSRRPRRLAAAADGAGLLGVAPGVQVQHGAGPQHLRRALAARRSRPFAPGDPHTRAAQPRVSPQR